MPPRRRIDVVCSTILLVGLAAWATVAGPLLALLPLGLVISGSVVGPLVLVRATSGPLGLILVLVVKPIAVHRLLLRRRALPLTLMTAVLCAALTWLDPSLLRFAA